MARPAVLHLIESFREGGSEGQAAQLVRLLHDGGRYRLHVAVLNGDGPHRDDVEEIGLGPIEAYPLTSFYNARTVRQLARLVAWLRRNKVSVVHTHDFYTNIFGMAAAAIARVPVRIAARRETLGTRSPAQKRVERAAFRLATSVVANAEAVRRVLVAEGVAAHRTITVYNGVDLDRVACDATREVALARLGLPKHDGLRFVTIVANLRLPVKDHPTFLRAARRVVAARGATAFVVAGEGELLDATRSLASGLGVGDATHFLGGCDRIGDLLAISDVCVLSSRAEGFSNAILEYMAAGRPVVATDVGGAREAIVDGESGYLVPPGDDEAMAGRIVELLDDPERARAFGLRGREIVERRFSCDAQRSSVEGLYEKLLEKPRRTRRFGTTMAQQAERSEV